MVENSSQQVLANSDLLYEILDHLSHDHASAEGQLALARAARVCTTFSHPALSVLWSSLQNLFPLWFTLTPFKTIAMSKSTVKYVRSLRNVEYCCEG